ncbi:Uncharacterised protein [Streptococcus pneumoniae]|nr:Uncharacterised protein [Streptococcus pneumoniae]CJH76983.1 Uncharacterised protein [Streptococcus pneumoniae]CJJ22013.1 Uncharacterised protein [Streptococcus pneumoniae]COL55778.1 Uncharacterised protein [Streptococcus pneumoniae]COU19637.1 Uncharacterised protein [Streptococcus pneumoniae]
MHIFFIFSLCGRDSSRCISTYFLTCKLPEKTLIYATFSPEGSRSILKTTPDNGSSCADVRAGIRAGSFSSISVTPIPVIAEPKKIGYTFACCICCSSFSLNSASGIISLFTYDSSNDSLNGVNSSIQSSYDLYSMIRASFVPSFRTE